MTSHDHGRPLDDRGTLASHPWPTGHPAQSVPLDSFDTMLKFNVEKKVRTFWKDRLVANANFEREQYFSNGIHFQDPEGIQYGWSDQICWRGFSQNIKYSHTRYDISLKCLQAGLWNLLGQVRILTGDMRHETFETTRVRWYSPPIQSHINRCDIHYLYIWFDDFISYVAMWSLNRRTFTLSLRSVVAFSMLWVPDLLWGILCASEASPRPLEIPPSWPHQISNWNSGVFRFEMSDSESKISIFCLGILEQGRQALFPGILHSYGMCKTGNKKQQETNLCGHVPSFSVTV